jgi:hypothetical protein
MKIVIARTSLVLGFTLCAGTLLAQTSPPPQLSGIIYSNSYIVGFAPPITTWRMANNGSYGTSVAQRLMLDMSPFGGEGHTLPGSAYYQYNSSTLGWLSTCFRCTTRAPR